MSWRPSCGRCRDGGVEAGEVERRVRPLSQELLQEPRREARPGLKSKRNGFCR